MSAQAYGRDSATVYDGGSFGSYGRKRRSKTDWAGVTLGDAFKGNLDYFTRSSAQRTFYAVCRAVQMKAARVAGQPMAPAFQPSVKPQLGPCYTTYPSNLAAYAAIGLTGFLEFRSRATAGTLLLRFVDYLSHAPASDVGHVDAATYRKLVEIVIACVQDRLLLEDLSRVNALSTVEIYRLFSASQQRMKFATLPEMLDAVILYGDVLTDWKTLNLHPTSACILTELTEVCQPYFGELAAGGPEVTSGVGVRWVNDVCRCLMKHLPPARAEKGPKPGEKLDAGANGASPGPLSRADSGESVNSRTDRLAPLDGPQCPTLFEPSSTEQWAATMLPGAASDPAAKGDSPSEAQKQIQQTLQDFASTVDKAAGQDAAYEDMRSDLVERSLRQSTFSPGPIEGNPTDGHEVSVCLGEEETAAGEVFDRPVELSDDLPAYQQLLEESLPISTALKRTLYPNVEELPDSQRLRTTGSLDPRRLALAEFSSVIFKRHRIIEKADRRGRPVLLIACDGSGSLEADQMKMLKLLAASWLTSTVKSGIQVLAGLYHSGLIRNGVSGPLVQWIYHPLKTPATGRVEAARAVVSLPNTGTGVQSDALSVAFMLEEARRIARGRMIYLILITDCAWNRSFNTVKTGAEEVRALFERLYEEHRDRLHTTLVALGVDKATGFEDLLDKVVIVSPQDLLNSAKVAEQVGTYVASCMKERKRFV